MQNVFMVIFGQKLKQISVFLTQAYVFYFGKNSYFLVDKI
jgi:hypothetical protein